MKNVNHSLTAKNDNPTKATSWPTPSGQVTLEISEALEIAVELHKKDSFDRAERLYVKILQTAPDNLDALHYLGLLCHQQNRKQDAINLLGEIIRVAPENADAHNNLGNVLEGMGKFDDAESCYRRAISLSPGHGPALNNLGVVLMAGNRAPEAVKIYQRAIKATPDSADFHYNLGNALVKSKEIQMGVTAYKKSISLEPGHSLAWQRLARTLVTAGQKKEAEETFEKWLKIEPGNPTVLYLQAACLGRGAPDRAPDHYVCDVFDDMADSFDTHLVGKLDYRAPDILIEALNTALPAPTACLDILDAGCGTGLCGPLLRPHAKELTGVDLSARMLAKARGRNVYDLLERNEITAFLNREINKFDVIASADTLCYFGNLLPLFKAGAKALKPDGILAFTVEKSDDNTRALKLNAHGRYSHTQSYTQETLLHAGFKILSISEEVLRRENGHPVSGFMVTAGKEGLVLT